MAYGVSIEEFATVVGKDIKNGILVYDVGTIAKIPGSSTEDHKEHEDKAGMKIMCILADNKFGPVVYLDEIEFTPQGDSTGPR